MKQKNHIIPLAGGAKANLDIITGKEKITIPDISDEIMGIQISHIIGENDDVYNCGKNARLNLHESFVKNEESGQYVYTDELGESHSLMNRYYYVDNNNTRHDVTNQSEDIAYNKGEMLINVEGEFYKVYSEAKGEYGLKGVTEYEDIKNIELYEKRTNEVKQLDEQIDTIEKTICDFEIVNEDGERQATMENKEVITYFDDFIGVEGYLLTKEEALTLKGLLIQETTLSNTINESLPITIALNNLEIDYLETCGNQSQSTEYFQDKAEELQLYTEYLDESQREELNSQKSNVEAQISTLKGRNTIYREQLNEYYKEYYNLFLQRKLIKKQLPARSIVKKNVARVFNEEGELIAVCTTGKDTIFVEYEYMFGYDSSKISRLYNEKGRSISFRYNGSRLSEIVDANGGITRFDYGDGTEYDDNDELVKVTYPNGKTLSISKGNSVILKSEKEKSLIVHSSTEPTKVFSITNASLYENVLYDAASLSQAISKEYTVTYGDSKTTILDEKGTGKEYRYNSEEQIIEEREITKNRVTNAKRYEYTQDKLTKIEYPKRSCLHEQNGDTTFSFETDYTDTFTYDSFERVATKATEWIYVTDTTRLRTYITYTYDKNNRVVQIETMEITDKNGTISEKYHYDIFSYDYDGKLVREESYVRNEENINGVDIKEYFYDENGFNIKTVVYNSLDPSSKLYSEKAVDKNGRVVSELDALGKNNISYEYLLNGTTVGSTSYPNGSKLSFGYDERTGNTAITQSTEDGEENSIQSFYTKGLPTRVVSGDTVYDYCYDGQGRVTRVKINGSTYVTYEYTRMDAQDVVEATYANGYKETVCDYPIGTDTVLLENDINKVVCKLYTKGKLATFAKLSGGNTENVTFYTYDGQDKLTKAVVKEGEDQTEVYSEEYTYDDNGDLTGKVILTDGTSNVYMYAYDTDYKRALNQITYGSTIIRPKKDCLGRNIEKSICIGNEEKYNQKISYLKHGDRATLMPNRIDYTVAGSKKSNVRYTYDNMGNVHEIYENGEFMVEYEYDALNRLIRENNKKLNKTYIYEYDKNNNIVAKRIYPFVLESYDKVIRPLNEETATVTVQKYEYSSSKLTSFNGQAIEYDVMGNPTTYRGNTLTWGYGRRLNAFGSNTFTYDASGRRKSKNGLTFKYDIDGKLIKQSDGLEFIYDNETVIGIESSGVKLFYKKDIFDNVTELIDTNGTTVVKYVYDAWGNATVYNANGDIVSPSTNFIGNINPIRYRSYYYDKETGLYYLQSRYYDPQTGRFINMDQLSYLDPKTVGGANLYAYCNNNPVMNVDPSGHAVISLVAVIIGAVVGAAIGFGSTVYADYKDDGQIFNGSIEWYDYLGATALGGVIGAGVGAVGSLGGAYLAGGIGSVASNFVGEAASSLVTGTNNFGTWYEYGIAFIAGGLSRGKLASLNGAKGFFAKGGINLLEVLTAELINTAYEGDFNERNFSYNIISFILNDMGKYLMKKIKNN